MGIGVGLCALLRTGIEGMERGTLCRSQRGVESLILCLIEGAVQVIGLAPVVPGSGEHLVVIQALGRDDGSHGIIEMEPLIAGQAADLVGQRTIGQGAGGHQNGCTLIDVLHLLPHHGDVGALLHPPGHGGAECIPVHGQCAARGHTGLLGASSSWLPIRRISSFSRPEAESRRSAFRLLEQISSAKPALL